MADLEAHDASMLLIHDGELADVRELLEELGLGFVEAGTRTVSTDDTLEAAIVISTPQFLSSRINSGEIGTGIRIAIIDDHAKTLLAMLSRGGVEWLVRRPFHPSALRLLLLHCLYQGPEKRRARRVSVGAAVHYQTGWRKRGAILAEISRRDCRLLSSRSLEVGRRLKVRLPAELAGRRTLRLAGRVVRTGRSAESDGSHEICVVFDPPKSDEAQRLKELVSAHARGPAVLNPSVALKLARARPPGPAGDARSSAAPLSEGGLAAEEAPGAAAAPETGDRRSDSRHEYRRRVIALSQEATRVLVGRDISRKGMRVEPTPSLALGSELQIALHVAGQDTPLVVDVRVHRDDGARGLVLRFVDLPEGVSGYLDRMLGDLPGLVGAADGGDQPFVVSEIVEARI
jgi:hypothetical protein